MVSGWRDDDGAAVADTNSWASARSFVGYGGSDLISGRSVGRAGGAGATAEEAV